MANATAYTIETSQDGQVWTARVTETEKPSQLHMTYTLDEAVQAPYVRLRVKDYENAGGGASWFHGSV